MRVGQGQTAALAMMIAAALPQSRGTEVIRKGSDLPTANYTTVSSGGRRAGRQSRVSNFAKRGVRRRQTRGRR